MPKWTPGDIGAFIFNRSDTKTVVRALQSVDTQSRRKRRNCGVYGWLNNFCGRWQCDGHNFAVGVTAHGAMTMQTKAEEELPQPIRDILPLVKWVPGLRRPSERPSDESLVVPKNTKFTFSELFSGIGGFRVGCESVRGFCVAAAEPERYCRQTYEDNFGHPPHFRCVTQIETAAFPSHNLLTGGFPCGPFTRAAANNRQGFNDPRGLLFHQITRILKDVQPEAFLLENVPGVLDQSDTIVADLKTANYSVHVFQHDAASVIPQTRKRVFFVGFRKDLGINKYEVPQIPQFKRVTSEALNWNLSDDDIMKYTIPEETLTRVFNRNMAQIRQGERYAVMDKPYATLQSSYKKLTAYCQLIDGKRLLTEREFSRMMGFPDTFKYSEVRSYPQLGNAVPPPIVSVIASDIISQFNPNVSLSDGWSAAARLAINSSNDSSDIRMRFVDLPTGQQITINELADAEDGSLGF